MTIFVGNEVVVQFRPRQYQLDLQLADAACHVYGELAPKTKYITTVPSSGLLVYTMERIQGISYKEAWGMASIEESFAYRATLCQGFAEFMSLSWQNRNNVADLPLGRVGKSLVGRLKSLSQDLPARFQPKACHLLQRLYHIENLPWVLTHGDIIAANIIVDPASGKLRGLVDWAETERLPFGICFYGLEEILGEVGPRGFQYYSSASQLRAIFWAELGKFIPELKNDETLEAVKLAKDLGILLWYGIAFDNGNIDRVVQEGMDVEEIHKLEVFLDLNPENAHDMKSMI